MKSHTFCIVVAAALAAAACGDGTPSTKPPSKTAEDVTSSGGAKTMTWEEKKGKAELIVARAKAAMSVASEAIKIADSPELTKDVAATGGTCPIGDDEEPEAEPRLVGVLVKCAIGKLHETLTTKSVERIIQTEPSVARGVELAQLALQAAEKLASQREARRQAKIEEERQRVDHEVAEKAALEKAEAACAKDESGCKSKCNSNATDAGTYCLALGRRLFEKQAFDQASIAVTRSCTLGVKMACSLPEKIAEAKDAATLWWCGPRLLPTRVSGPSASTPPKATDTVGGSTDERCVPSKDNCTGSCRPATEAHCFLIKLAKNSALSDVECSSTAAGCNQERYRWATKSGWSVGACNRYTKDLPPEQWEGSHRWLGRNKICDPQCRDAPPIKL